MGTLLYIVMVIAHTAIAYVVMAIVVRTCIVMAVVVMAYALHGNHGLCIQDLQVVIAYIIMACVSMASK